MRIDELKRIAEENGYEFYNGYVRIEISRRIGDSDCKNEISMGKYLLNTLWISNVDCQDNDLKVIKAAIEFAETPVKEREEVKKFWIQHNFMVSKNLFPVNLVWNRKKDVYRALCLQVDNHIYQAQFTFKEYEEIKKKLNTDLKDFELVEVEE